MGCARAGSATAPARAAVVALDASELIMIMIFIIEIREGVSVQRLWRGGALAALCFLGMGTARADDTVFTIEVVKGVFQPPELVVPADHAFQLHVTNRDAAAIEFESFELHRERVVPPGQTIEVSFPSLSPGSYEFFDDFHDSVEHGAIVVK